jgi:hypothetical protein
MHDKAPVIQIVIYTLDGRTIKSVRAFAETGADKVELILHGLPPSLYIYQLYFDQKTPTAGYFLWK